MAPSSCSQTPSVLCLLLYLFLALLYLVLVAAVTNYQKLWFKQWKFVPWFWGPEVPKQGVSRAMFPLEALRGEHFLTLPSVQCLLTFLGFCSNFCLRCIAFSSSVKAPQCALHKILDTGVSIYLGNLTQLESIRGFLGGSDGNEDA